MAGRAVLVAFVLCLSVAGPAAAHPVNLTVAFQESPACPTGQPVCIRLEAGAGSTDVVEDPYAEFEVGGIHDVRITVENRGNTSHNLTFEPGTPAADHSLDGEIAPGDTAEINFTTIEDIPPGQYAFYGGMAGHRQLGEEGLMTVVNGTQRAPTDLPEHAKRNSSDTAQEIVGVPAPSGVAVAVVLSAFALALRRRRS